APMAGMIDDSENVPDAAIWKRGAPSSEKRVVPSSRPPVAIGTPPTSHSSPWSRSQKKQAPHWGTQEITTWSPGFRCSTPSPTPPFRGQFGRLGSPAGLAVLPFGGPGREAEHDGGGQHQGAGDQAGDDHGHHDGRETGDGTDDEHHHRDSEQRVPDLLAPGRGP